MAFVSEGTSIACCIDVHRDLEEKARYALRMLMVPLNLEPRWVSVGEQAGGIYYGSGPADAAVRLAAAEDAPHFFSAVEPYDAQRATWFEGQEGRLPAMFTSPEGEPDLIASTFLWLSGWQEVATRTRDEHGRIPYASSLPGRLDVAHRPVVDAYRTLLERQLRQAGISFRRRKWSSRDWALCPTHDVDYLRKWRPGILYREFVQNVLLNRRQVGIGDRMRRAERALQQFGKEDPYRAALRMMPGEVTRRGGTATYFVKAGGQDPHDVPYSLESAFFEEWSREIVGQDFEIGLHPSYRTPTDHQLLETQAGRLRKITRVEVAAVRHHYLRFDPGETPRIHEALGLNIDSTLGFAEHEGFRRGTCLPFQLFDVEGDRALDVWEMPLAVMDSALFNRRQLDASGALEVTRSLAAACRRYGGALVALWHNMLGDELEAAGWEKHFKDTLDYAAANGAAIASLSSALRGWQ